MEVEFFKRAGVVAEQATCRRARCGSIVVSSDNEIIGEGFNAPPLNDESQRMCDEDFGGSAKAKSDRTCCVHAEWNAILNAVGANSDKVKGATLYFMRVDKDGNFTEAGRPYCTVCSRLALQSGILRFGLWNNGPDFYDTQTYNRISYDFHR